MWWKTNTDARHLNSPGQKKAFQLLKKKNKNIYVMQHTTFYATLLSLLGINLQSCSNNDEDDTPVEYGSPYAVFKAQGTIKSNEGEGIDNATITFESITIKNDSDINARIVTNTQSDDNGKFSTATTISPTQRNYRMISSKEGYKSDTTVFEINTSDLTGNKSEWNIGTATKEFNIVLNKADNKDK